MRQGATPDLIYQKPFKSRGDKLQARHPTSLRMQHTYTPYLRTLATPRNYWCDGHKNKQIKSSTPLITPPFFFPPVLKEKLGVRTSCLGPSSPCIFKRAKGQSSPFFSWATHPSQCWQYNSLVKMRSSGPILAFPLWQLQQYYFTADTCRALGKVEKSGIPKCPVGTTVLRGLWGMGRYHVAVDCCGADIGRR